MILRSSPSSPFVRKVSIAAAILGLDRDIKFEPADTVDPSDPVRRQNPLGKIPVLILDDGTAIYDSPVILEYLDHRAGGGRIIPRDRAARFAALRLQALCDGIMDAGILLVYEARWRPAERHEAKWLDHQTGKIARALATLEADPPRVNATPNVGQIATACALGYLDFRFANLGWRDTRPNTAAWFARFGERKSMVATRPPPA